MKSLNYLKFGFLLTGTIICAFLLSCEEKNKGRVIPGGSLESKKLYPEGATPGPSPFGEFKFDPYADKDKWMLLQVVHEELRFDENYNASYYFTLKNNLEKPTVAFKLIYSVGNGIELEKKFKVRIKPRGIYSNRIKVSGDGASSSNSFIRVANVILQGGEMIDIASN